MNRTSSTFLTLSCLTIVSLTISLIAQGPPPMRQHTANKAKPLTLLPASETPPAEQRESIEEQGESRVVVSNAIPGHLVGVFPNRANPHTIEEQKYHFVLPANPKPAAETTPTHNSSPTGPPNRPFGIALNGVLFDPGTAEFWNADREADWNYEALGGALRLGLDENHAHVQPSGAYHYHGISKLYLRAIGAGRDKHSPLVGWAADGFPIYALYGNKDPQDPRSPIVEMTSSYQLKDGQRPSGDEGPGGEYDGAFSRDYEYVENSGTLDECNGRFCITPDFPEGTYAYFLTGEWPVVPRNFRGTPVELRPAGGGTRGERGGKGGKGKGGPPR
ncbi:MAG: YHYH protein [Verrucomicrobiales bacterium]|nr:YHYH protein [Verrucomicrobiales bacterium]